MHEEETLESLYRLQTEAVRRFAGILSELRRRDKLFITCNFPDWVGRAMLRLVNDDWLYAKYTQEFFCPNTNDAGLSAFLTQYSPNTMGFEGQADKLIKQLTSSLAAVSPSPKPSVASRKESNIRGPTVFVSYASENADAARSLPIRYSLTQNTHGRDQDSDALLHCVLAAPVAVLFSKSGLGKSSLLQAGLFPRLCNERLLPVYVRLNHSKNAASASELNFLSHYTSRIFNEIPMRNMKLTYLAVMLLMVLITNGSVWAWGGGHRHSHLGIGLGYYGPGFYGGYGYGGYGFGGYGYGYPFYYPPPYVYPQTVIVPTSPPVYIQQPQVQPVQPQTSYWYYCQNPEGYYPYVKNCPAGWLQVAPQPPGQ